MGRKYRILLWLVSAVMWLTAGAVWAGQSGSQPVRGGGSDLGAGVVVDYMGKLRFLVLERDTLKPIEGAAVELYISSLERYVLFGLTDGDGIYELDIAYNTNPDADLNAQFTTAGDGFSFPGSLLYLNSNRIAYQVYKGGWLLYPTQGEVVLGSKEMPQVVTIYLYKKGSDNGGPSDPEPKPPGISESNGGSPETRLQQLLDLISEAVPLSGLLDGEDPVRTGGIPRTGVEGAVPYWIAGLIFFVLAGGILWYLLKKEKAFREQEKG